MYEHKTGIFHGFTSRYNGNKLIYFEEFSDIHKAIEREKQIKAGSRKRKEQLVNRENPNWKDLAKGWLFYLDRIV
ncbi:GIY-YIG nuclease family protein [Arenibacter echinorum]|uniref:GIY-YIG nuclease family protein n=1 Tax=Arenibacter echinorum TaxID=440515 RepID=UPI002936EFDA|nr:GIY-YIG nuclease family protein [Arenibacter echinorum]